MIFEIIPRNQSMALRGWSCSTPAKVVQIPKVDDIVDFCPCEFGSCEYEELAFAYSLDASNTYKNDYRALLLTLLDDTSTYELYLVGSDGVEIPFIDDTYGKFSNLQNPLKIGFVLDWNKVFTLLGGDIYKIRVNQTDFSNTVSKDSHNFRLMEFSELASNGTVKIETIQKGEFLFGESYKGFDWKNMIRLVAQFGNEEKQTEIDRLKDSEYNDYDVQVSGFYQYTLKTNLLPSFIADRVIDKDTMTDDIKISNYDMFAYRQYRDLQVVFSGDIDATNDYSKETKKSFEIKFNDIQTNIKRNFIS